MRGSIEMNLLKQIASRAVVFMLALAILVPAVVVAGSSNAVQAEKLATVYLTNKATGFTTEASPPSSRSNPASRTNASICLCLRSIILFVNQNGIYLF